MNDLAAAETSIMERLVEVATLAGIKGELDSDGKRFAAGYRFDDGRTQMVYVREIRTPGGPGVCVYSPAARYKKGFFGGLSHKHAIQLLLENDKLCFARYGIKETDEEYYVVASVDLLIDTLDPEELRAAMGSVSAAADSWEERSGKDEF